MKTIPAQTGNGTLMLIVVLFAVKLSFCWVPCSLLLCWLPLCWVSWCLS